MIRRLARFYILILAMHSTVSLAQSNTALPYREGRILVQPLSALVLDRLAAFHSAQGAHLRHQFSRLGNLQVVELPKGATALEMVRRYQRSGLVAFAEPD